MTGQVYPFTHPHEADRQTLTELLGGKGYSLWMMSHELGLPVPPGFTIPTTATAEVLAPGGPLARGLDQIEATIGRKFGAARQPLLLSVRSGAAQSMPGMMDTILNVGMTPENTRDLALRTGNPRFAWESYRRFLVSFATLVQGRPAKADCADLIEATDLEMACEGLRNYIDDARVDTPMAQLTTAIGCVFRSWNSARAIAYREKVGLPHCGSTAVNIQAMVFGNLDDASGTGVAFTRNPSTGAPERCGDFMFRAQGDDVVGGDSLTQPLDEFRVAMPAVYAELEDAMARLELHYRDMCDIEFTVESGRLWLLQARAGKRSPAAAPRIAVDLCEEGMLTKAEALARVSPDMLEQGAHSGRARSGSAPIGKGLAASPGVATGEIVFDPDRSLELAEEGKDVILVRRETSPEDVHGMGVAKGVLTTLGGMMSHAAVVARAWGIPAVCSMENVTLSAEGLLCGGKVYREGDILTIDGKSGLVFAGAIQAEHDVDPYVGTLLAWAAKNNQNQVREERA